MSQHDHYPGTSLLAELRAQDDAFNRWLDRLRRRDPVFATASVLNSDSWGEWQAGLYLITGSREVWRALEQPVITERSLTPVYSELQDPSRGWSSGEHTILAWAAHLWNVSDTDVTFPYNLDEHLFHRWITACHLRQHTTPLQARGGAPA